MNGLLFHNPFWGLAILPLGMALWLSLRRRRRRAVLFSDVGLVEKLPPTFALVFKRRLPLLGFLGLLLSSLALARPQQGKEEFRVHTEGIAIQIALDRSGSMQALDFHLDNKRARRIDAAKAVTRDFITGGEELPGRPDDLLGLVVFGGFSESLCPLTLDHGALLQILHGVDVPQPIRDENGRILNQKFLKEESATAIGDAVALCVERLRNVKAKSRVVILLSDGENTAGVVDPLDAADTAAEFGIRVYTIGIGSTGTAPFETIDVFGRKVLRAAPVKLDEKLLTALAEKTDGRYFNARDTDSLEKVYAAIGELEKTEIEGRRFTQYRELYQALLVPGIFLLAAEMFLRCTRFRSLP